MTLKWHRCTRITWSLKLQSSCAVLKLKAASELPCNRNMGPIAPLANCVGPREIPGSAAIASPEILARSGPWQPVLASSSRAAFAYKHWGVAAATFVSRRVFCCFARPDALISLLSFPPSQNVPHGTPVDAPRAARNPPDRRARRPAPGLDGPAHS